MDKMHLGHHISGQFNADLEALKTEVLEMGGLVEQQVISAVKALTTADSELADEVIQIEDEVDEFEMRLDEQCTLILARRQPAASDLRMVLAVAKIIRDLERMGDEAQKIAKMAIQVNQEGEAPRGYVELRHLGSLAHQMVINTLDCFARFDVKLALMVAKDDNRVDQEYKSSIRELVTYMMEDPRSITRVLNIIWALRSLERVGDHARNIAEHVIFLVRGLDVRHASLQEMERQLKATDDD